jgi:Ser/Thr protein kinase RdoA (MazF antagonist)
MAHGLDGTLVEPDWAPLTLAEVRAILKQYPECGEPTRILSVSPRPFSAASVVATRRGPAFVKRHARAVRDREGLMEEHRFMAHLLAHGAKVPRVMRTARGDTAIEAGAWTYEVHDVPSGVDLYGDALSWTPFRSVNHARAAGEALARLHAASESFDVPRREPRPLVASFSIFAAHDAGAEMDRYVALRPALAKYMRTRDCRDEALDLLAPFHAELLPFLRALKPMWTHNDLHGSNLLWSDGSDSACATATIDFGLADRTNAVHDLSHAIERNVVEWLALVENPGRPGDVPVHLDLLHALLGGYESVRRLTDAEAAALPSMTALCHAEFALSETDYFLAVLHSDGKAAMACEGWLVSHARWFHSARGVELLDAIHRWSERRQLAAAATSRDESR